MIIHVVVTGMYDAVVCFNDSLLHHELRVVDFLGEEANTYGVSCLGSRAITGALTAAHLSFVDPAGTVLGTAYDSFGLDPHAALGAAWGAEEVHAFLELHVEQGPRLERMKTSVGIVTGIAGIERLMASFAGRADHAGTMPMNERRDALTAAARAVLAIEATAACAEVEAVATTGRIEVTPGALNVIPDRARIWAEIRSLDGSWLDSAQLRLTEEIVAAGRARGIAAEVSWLTDQPPVLMARSMQDLIAESADEIGLAWAPVPSGAGHDAAHMSRLGPTGMIFVPSKDGKSHCPEERTGLPQIVDGAKLLAATVLRLDTWSAKRQGVPA